MSKYGLALLMTIQHILWDGFCVWRCSGGGRIGRFLLTSKKLAFVIHPVEMNSYASQVHKRHGMDCVKQTVRAAGHTAIPPLLFSMSCDLSAVLQACHRDWCDFRVNTKSGIVFARLTDESIRIKSIVLTRV